ncbi:MAG TPA: pentapeptide repeat-containing protein [Oscillatoriaceae cyanobacterium M33_DOE_052]|uniref:Pentapeptide repeat-containing protein n=1 Tax=Planktothricoides sp. SpSt-374 TaxID=2282167 RepID=A0A7C3ZK98_9CYAN|nr:pentapeptide repeat-containing protein [Oscillatoriaceae cyanobacterium M33_DOE_052]
MQTKNLDWLKIGEYVSLAGAVAGSVAAVAFGQIVYPAVLLFLSLWLNLINRHREEAINQQRILKAIIQLDHSLGDISQSLTSQVGDFSAKIGEIQENTKSDALAAAFGTSISSLLDSPLAVVEKLQQQMSAVAQTIAPVPNQLETLKNELSHQSEFLENLDSLQQTIAELNRKLEDPTFFPPKTNAEITNSRDEMPWMGQDLAQAIAPVEEPIPAQWQNSVPSSPSTVDYTAQFAPTWSDRPEDQPYTKVEITPELQQTTPPFYPEDPLEREELWPEYQPSPQDFAPQTSQVMWQTATPSPQNIPSQSSNLDLSQANLIGVNLTQANLAGAMLAGSDLSGTDLSGADLSRADLSEANLEGANLDRANLEGANLEGAYLNQANLSGAQLRGANLSRAHLAGANLSSANLSYLNLSAANLSQSILAASDLTESHLVSANLSYANLSYANLEAANLTYADLTGADLTGAHLGEGNRRALFTGAILPDGSQSPRQ